MRLSVCAQRIEPYQMQNPIRALLDIFFSPRRHQLARPLDLGECSEGQIPRIQIGGT
jgi:hypothetical protein